MVPSYNSHVICSHYNYFPILAVSPQKYWIFIIISIFISLYYDFNLIICIISSCYCTCSLPLPSYSIHQSSDFLNSFLCNFPQLSEISYKKVEWMGHGVAFVPGHNKSTYVVHFLPSLSSLSSFIVHHWESMFEKLIFTLSTILKLEKQQGRTHDKISIVEQVSFLLT